MGAIRFSGYFHFWNNHFKQRLITAQYVEIKNILYKYVEKQAKNYTKKTSTKLALEINMKIDVAMKIGQSIILKGLTPGWQTQA